MDDQHPTSLTHSFMTQVILLQSKAGTSEEDLATFLKGIHALKRRISCLIAVSAGENQSTRHCGFTHGILLHFENEERMRNAIQQPTYEHMLKKAWQLSETVVILELPETLPLPTPPSAPVDAPQARPERTKKRGSSRKSSAATSGPFAPPSQPSVNVRAELRRQPVTAIDPRIKQLIIEQFGVDESDVVPGASLVEDLNADSLDLVEYIMSVEERFHVTVSDEDAEQITTVGETQAYLLAKGAL